MSMEKEKNLETCLAISTGLLVLWFIFRIKTLIIAAVVIGCIGLFFNPLAGFINWLWYRMADVLGFIVSRILLSIVFLGVLFPFSLIYRLFNKDTLQLQKRERGNTYWIEREHQYTGKDLQNIW
ncbi:MAG: hypothetical protein PVH61_01275 [Candidatus Aminicenantes bacterium]